MLTLASRLDAMQRLGRAMADPTRSRILLSLLACPAHPAELANALDLMRSNVSNHLGCLRDCGIVVATHAGRQALYEIADPHLARAPPEPVAAKRTLPPRRPRTPPAQRSPRAL